MSPAPAVRPDNFITFGDLLKYLRRRAGLTQRELSIAVGYSESLLSRLEKNQRIPDQAALSARFVPALHLQHEPDWAGRLLALAVAARAGGVSRPDALDATAAPNNLPLHLTSFVGREHEISEVWRLLSAARLLTLTGSGGCGKSRLALQAATGLLGDFPGGVRLIQLAPLAHPALVPQTVAVTLGIREARERSFPAALAEHLHGQKVLLVLDNCEHLVVACAQLAEALLQACPHLRILATSREALGVPGEQAFRVPSLAAPDPAEALTAEALGQYEAVRLFVQRAAMALPGFRLTSDNAQAVAQVCRRLDGMPLAIELAAPRVKMLRVEEIADRLTDTFDLLAGGSRGALPRHQTLRATMDWSHHTLLSGPERALLRRLSVFAGGWGLKAAEEICGQALPPQAGGRGEGNLAVLDLLTLLVNKSLVIVEREQGQEARYRLLETLRQYGSQKLVEAGEEDVVRERHYDWFLALAERAEPELRGGRDQAAWSRRLDIEHDNLRAGLRWSLAAGQVEAGTRLAAALWAFWTDRGYFREGRGWLEAGLARREQLSKPVVARVLRGIGRLAARQGNFDIAEAYAAESVALCRELGDQTELAPALRNLGAVVQERGDLERSETYFAEALGLYQKAGHKYGISEQLCDLGWCAVMRGDHARGVLLLEEALALMQEIGDSYGIGYTLFALGTSRCLQGEAEEATRLLGEGLTLLHQLGNTWMIVSCLQALARVANLRGQPGRAARLLGASEHLDEMIGGEREGFWIRVIQEPARASARAQLGEAAVKAAWAAGHAMTLDEAIEFALGAPIE
jgi:non-specific serine/threonine protein kinase